MIHACCCVTVAFIPHPIPDMEHHFNVALCEEPGFASTSASDQPVWNCFGDEFGNQPDLPNGSICDGEHMMHMFSSFDTAAPALRLPDGFGFKTRGFNYVVLATHYPEVRGLRNGLTGHSELELRMVPEDEGKRRKPVGIFNVEAWGLIPPLSTGSMSGSYVYDQSIAMQPIAVLTHTHARGLDFEVWLTSGDGNTKTLMWKQDPNRDVYWHFPSHPFPSISDGDKITLRCLFNNTSPEQLVVE